MTEQNTALPDHVDPAMVRDFMFDQQPGFQEEPHTVASSLLDGPRVFYVRNINRDGRDFWVFNRYEDVRAILQDAETFSSSEVANFQGFIGETWPMIPLELNGVRHQQFRNLLNPLFAPNRVNDMEQGVRSLAISLIEKFRDKGECEFVEDFGRPYPISIFLQLMGLPLDMRSTFLGWEYQVLHGTDMETRRDGSKKIIDYLRQAIAERRNNLGDDLISFAIKAKIDGEPITDDEVIGLVFMLYIGGLDTVVASLGFIFKYLAEHPEQRQQLIDDPSSIPVAVDEFLRVFASVNNNRLVTRDVELAGVKMKKGDRVYLSILSANRDPAEFSHPDDVDLSRRPNRHITFAVGPHRCIGSHLARRELKIAIEEWLARIPNFRPKPGEAMPAHAGAVWGIEYIPLIWDR